MKSYQHYALGIGKSPTQPPQIYSFSRLKYLQHEI